MKAAGASIVALSLAACGSPASPSALPCNIYVRTDLLTDGTKYIVWTNARGEDCSILKPLPSATGGVR